MVDDEAPLRSPSEIRREGNHLVPERSAYLQQHAHNPVDWHPWGPEVLALAKEQDKPVLLSIGYASCHWCHVMEAEVFDDDDVAEALNGRFISIKVGREERPDVDAVYMEAVQTLTGSGGWPLSVFLTPDLKPFYGGTYLPREQFLHVVYEVARLYADDRPVIEEQAQGLAQLTGPARPPPVALPGSSRSTRRPGPSLKHAIPRGAASRAGRGSRCPRCGRSFCAATARRARPTWPPRYAGSATWRRSGSGSSTAGDAGRTRPIPAP